MAHNPIKSPDGHVIGVAVFARDITERKQGEEQMRQMNEELERRVIERTMPISFTREHRRCRPW